MRRGSTSRSQISAGSARPCSGTSTSRSRSIPAPAGGWRSTPCHAGRKAASARAVGRLDLLAQRRQRGAAQAAQDLDVAPLALPCRPGAARRGRARRRARARAGRRPRRRRSARGAPRWQTARACARSARRARAARRARPQEGLGQPAGRDGAERVAVQTGLVGRHVALLAADAQADRAPFALELASSAAESIPSKTRSRTSAAVRSPTRRSTSCSPSRPVARVISERHCRSSSTCGERAGVDQLAQLLLAEQLAQQVAVERQRRRAALGGGRVALVHVGGDVVEQQRGGERRGGRGLDFDERDLAACAARAAAFPGRARRARRAGTRGRSPAGSGSRRSAWRPRAGSAPSGAAATAACAGRDRRAGSTARGRRSRESARRTAPSRRARR